MSTLPPHLIPEEDELREELSPPPKHKSKLSRQGPSKYGAWGRRVAKAKGRKKK